MTGTPGPSGWCSRRSGRPGEESDPHAAPDRITRPTLRIIAGLEVDVQVPWTEPENGRKTPIVCDCSHLFVSSQRPIGPRQSWYHLHCPACGRAGAVPAALWEEIRRQLADDQLKDGQEGL